MSDAIRNQGASSALSATISAAQFLQHEELLDGMPRRPRLVPELLLVPAGPTSLTLYGAQRPRTLQCGAGVEVLRRLLALLDGTRTLPDIEAEIGHAIEGGATGLVSLLFRYGLLEEADDHATREHDITGSPPPSPAVTAYLGRFVGGTRMHANRESAIRAAQAIRLGIWAPRAAVASLRRAVDGMPFGAVRIAAIEDARGGQPAALDLDSSTHALFIGTAGPAAGPLEALSDRWLASGRPYLNARVGRSETHIGPYVLATQTATHRCAALQIEPPDEQPDALDLAWWATVVLHECQQLLLGLTHELYLNRVVVHAAGAEGFYPVVVKMAWLTGTAWQNGRDSDRRHANGAFAAWLHHVGTRPPPRELLSPRLFQTHFSLENVKLHDSPLPHAGAREEIALASPSELPALSSATPPDPHALSLSTLATVLRLVAGYQADADGAPRRIAPSAGQLQSTSCYLVANAVPGLSQGVYLFDGPRHTLVSLELPQATRLRQYLYGPLGAEASGVPPCTLIITSNLARLRSKYHDFGFNLTHLDAGVTTAWLAACAAAAGWRLGAPPRLPATRIADALLLADEANTHLVCTALHLFGGQASVSRPLVDARETADLLAMIDTPADHLVQAAEPAPDHDASQGATLRKLLRRATIDQLDTVLLQRRARYDFSDRPIDGESLRTLVALMLNRRDPHERARPAGPAWRPWLLLPRDTDILPAGVYDCPQDDPASWRRLGALSAGQIGQCVNQANFERAAAMLVVIADLEAALSGGDPAAYGKLHRDAGAAVGLAWIGASGMGLVGAPCGGVIEHGLRPYGTDGYRATALFSLALAHPAPAGAQTP